MPSESLDPKDLADIVELTLAHYGARSVSYREGTRHHDVRQNVAALLRNIQGKPPFSILDFGCGPGRDLKTFSELGHRAIERAALKSRGVLFTSNPRGNNEEGWSDGRYGVLHDLSSWRHYLNQAGFLELEHFYRPDGRPRDQQPWLASAWRKTIPFERSGRKAGPGRRQKSRWPLRSRF